MTDENEGKREGRLISLSGSTRRRRRRKRPVFRGASDLVNIDQAALRLGLSVRSVRSLVAAGRLSCVRVSARAVRFDPRDLDAFIEERRA